MQDRGNYLIQKIMVEYFNRRRLSPASFLSFKENYNPGWAIFLGGLIS